MIMNTEEVESFTSNINDNSLCKKKTGIIKIKRVMDLLEYESYYLKQNKEIN